MSKKYTEEQLLKAFKKFDKDGSGAIDEDEITAVLVEFGMFLSEAKRRAKHIMVTEDPNGDGQITYEEFKQILSKDQPGKSRNDIIKGGATGSIWDLESWPS